MFDAIVSPPRPTNEPVLSYAPGTTENDHPLPGLELTVIEQPLPGGDRANWNCCGLLKRECGRLHCQVLHRHKHILGIGSLRTAPKHFLAAFKCRHL